MSSGGSADQITQPPNGSFCGTPSSVTSARPAPDGAMARSDTPCVVGLADSDESRRDSDSPGTCSSAVSSSVAPRISAARNVATENAALPTGSGGLAVTTTVSIGAAEAAPAHIATAAPARRQRCKIVFIQPDATMQRADIKTCSPSPPLRGRGNSFVSRANLFSPTYPASLAAKAPHRPRNPQPHAG